MCFSVEVSSDLIFLQERFSAEINHPQFQKLKELQKDLNYSSLIKGSFESKIIYPNYFVPVIIFYGRERHLVPMRYRLRPNWSTEGDLPSKYNLFNARWDSLLTRKSWQPLLCKKHALFPFKRFMEWVERDGKKRLISFYPKDREIMWAAALWDQWKSGDGKFILNSFALITDDPPPEVVEAGHDRAPIFLKESNIESWLDCNEKVDKGYYLELLKDQEEVFYEAVL